MTKFQLDTLSVERQRSQWDEMGECQDLGVSDPSKPLPM